MYATVPELQDSDYFKDNYDVFNFNDFSMGLMTCFVILVSGGPLTQITDAYVPLQARLTATRMSRDAYTPETFLATNEERCHIPACCTTADKKI